MGMKAVFAGLNKHSDSRIPELSGAWRDATALWALFSDSITDLSARLLVDETATAQGRIDRIADQQRADRAERFPVLPAGRARPGARRGDRRRPRPGPQPRPFQATGHPGLRSAGQPAAADRACQYLKGRQQLRT